MFVKQSIMDQSGFEKFLDGLLKIGATIGVIILIRKFFEYLNSEEPPLISEEGRKILADKEKKKKLMELIDEYNKTNEWDIKKLKSILE